jgi:NAD(P)-dependent dehydrogenase (short-subunit alcohol dehydrogenase family)
MIPIDLKGRRALITGGDSGLGAATAKSLAQAGADIAIAYRDGPEAAEGVAASARPYGVKVSIARLADAAASAIAICL